MTRTRSGERLHGRTNLDVEAALVMSSWLVRPGEVRVTLLASANAI